MAKLIFYSTVFCPTCGYALPRIKLNDGSYVLMHGEHGGCPLEGKQFEIPWTECAEVKDVLPEKV